MRVVPTQFFQPLISLLIAAAVLLSGTHAKDFAIVTLPILWIDAKKQADDSGHHAVKAASDLHNHSDSSAKVHHASGDGHLSDTRSLRLIHHKKAAMLHNRLSDRLRTWWQLTALQLS